MKASIVVFLALALVTAAASCATIASTGFVTLSFLPKDVTLVPYTYFFGTLSMIFSVLTLTLLGRSWERDQFDAKFVDSVKWPAMIALLISSMPSMIFMSVVIQEIKKPKKPVPEKVRPTAGRSEFRAPVS